MPKPKGKIPVESPLNATLAKIPALSKRLNMLVDDASATVRKVEEFFEKAHVGVTEASVQVYLDDDSNTVDLKYLRMPNGKFRIALVTNYPAEGDDPPRTKVRPFSDCSRDEKLKAFEHLPPLLERIVDALEEMIDKTEKATRTINKTIGELPTIDNRQEQTEEAS